MTARKNEDSKARSEFRLPSRPCKTGICFGLLHRPISDTKLNASPVQNKQGGTPNASCMKMAWKPQELPGRTLRRKVQFHRNAEYRLALQSSGFAERGANKVIRPAPRTITAQHALLRLAQDIDLAAVFERLDSYTLTRTAKFRKLSDVDPNDTSKTLTKFSRAGKAPGDTEITVAPKAGYAAATGETYQVNGKAVEAESSTLAAAIPSPSPRTRFLLQDPTVPHLRLPEMAYGTIIATVHGQLWTIQ